MSVVQICQQQISPYYGVMYDRLYPVASAATITEENYSFAEKAEFTELYRRASNRSHRAGRICKKILIVLGIIAIPVVIFASFLGGMLGLFGCVCSVVPVAVPCLAVWFLSKVSERMDERFLENFDEKKIKENFQKSANEK